MGKVVQMQPKKEVKAPPVERQKLKKLPPDYTKMVQEYFNLVSTIGPLETRRKELAEKLKVANMTAKADRILEPELEVMLKDGKKVKVPIVCTLSKSKTPKRIVPEKLLLKGVPADTIEECSEQTEYYQITVREYKKPGEEK